MNKFRDRLSSHSDHVKKVGEHCITEETTKQALILPVLEILGFSPYDPTRVKAEYKADFSGVKAGERVDYALFCHNQPVMFIEAKSWNENLTNHCPQLSRYFNATPDVTVAAITNGKEWRFFMDLNQKNIMDETPFLRIKFEDLQDSDVSQLSKFRHDQFQSDVLRTLAEESIYLSLFTKAISISLRDVPADFVKFIANKAKVERQLTQKFIESITPIVKQAVEKTVSDMVVSGLTGKSALQEVEVIEEKQKEIDIKAPIINPENDKIITTYTERLLFEYIQSIVNDENITYKDTESYFNILYQNKSNRWMVRFFDKKQKPSILFPICITEQQKKEIERAGLELITGNQIIIDKPENVLRIAGLIIDVYEYVKLDDNFKRK